MKTKKGAAVKKAEEAGFEENASLAPITKIEKSFIKKEEPTSSFIVTFTVEGRSGWRHSSYRTKEAFDAYLSSQVKHPKVLVKRWFVLDHLTGDITEEK